MSRRRPLLRLAALATVSAAGLAMMSPRSGLACAACACGDPTLTVLGTEKPSPDRLRAGAALLFQNQTSGRPGIDEIDVREKRLELSGAWALFARLLLVGTLPLVRRDLAYANLQGKRAEGIGDFELRAKAFVWEDRPSSPRHLMAVMSGVQLPTSGSQRDAEGAPLPPEQQLSSGAVNALVGLTYAHFHFPWSEQVSIEATRPLYHRPWFRPSSSLRASAALQRHLGNIVALRLGVDTRTEGQTSEDGRLDPDTGGTMGFVSPAILLTPVTDLVVFALARLPVLQRFRGQQDQGAVLSTGMVYDF